MAEGDLGKEIKDKALERHYESIKSVDSTPEELGKAYRAIDRLARDKEKNLSKVFGGLMKFGSSKKKGPI